MKWIHYIQRSLAMDSGIRWGFTVFRSDRMRVTRCQLPIVPPPTTPQPWHLPSMRQHWQCHSRDCSDDHCDRRTTDSRAARACWYSTRPCPIGSVTKTLTTDDYKCEITGEWRRSTASFRVVVAPGRVTSSVCKSPAGWRYSSFMMNASNLSRCRVVVYGTATANKPTGWRTPPVTGYRSGPWPPPSTSYTINLIRILYVIQWRR